MNFVSHRKVSLERCPRLRFIDHLAQSAAELPVGRHGG